MPPSVERWDRIKELFDLALELPPGTRGDWLHQMCEGDPTSSCEPAEERTVIPGEESAFRFGDEPGRL